MAEPEAAPSPPAEPDAPEPAPRRSVPWGALLIGSGLLVLFAAGAWGLLSRPGVATGAPSAAAPALPVAPLPITPGPVGEGGSPGAETELDEPEPERAARPAPAPSGPSVDPSEATALVPVTPHHAVWGLVDALVSLDLYGDLECRYTRRMLRVLLALEEGSPRALRLVFHHFPLAGRPNAMLAARAVAAATARHGSEAAWAILRSAAYSRLDPGLSEVGRWLRGAGIAESVGELALPAASQVELEGDQRSAAELDVGATPTLFVNGRRLVGTHPENVLDAVIEEELRTTRWLTAQGLSAPEARARRVRKNLINVGSDAADRVCVPAGRAPAEGPSTALVTVVEFSDLHSESCRALESVLSGARARYPHDLMRVVRGFFDPEDRRGRQALAFALAARKEGGDAAFFRLHQRILAETSDLDDGGLVALADAAGLDGAGLLGKAEDPALERSIRADQELGQRLELDQIPALFVNGRRIDPDVSSEAFQELVREEIDAARRIVRRGSPEALQRILCAADAGD